MINFKLVKYVTDIICETFAMCQQFIWEIPDTLPHSMVLVSCTSEFTPYYTLSIERISIPVMVIVALADTMYTVIYLH